MARPRQFRELEITAGGGTKTLDLGLSYEVYYIYTSGSVTLTSNWTIDTSGTALKGMEIELRWRANVDLNGNTFTVLGDTLDPDLTNKNFNIRLYYNGSSWEKQIDIDYQENSWVDNRVIKNDSIQGTKLDYPNVLGEGLTEDGNLIEVEPDITNGTSIEKGVDGISLTGDASSPSNNFYYGVDDSGNKGYHSIGIPLSQYDSGWKEFPIFSNNSTGFVSVSNFTNPQFRVIGRVLHLRGDVLIPLDDGGGSLVSNKNDYPTEQRSTVHTANSGITINTGVNGVGEIIEFPTLLDDSELFPEKTELFKNTRAGKRRIQEKGSNKVLSLVAVPDFFRFNSSGTMSIASISNLEIPASEGDSNTHLKNVQLRRSGTIVKTDDFALDYTNYRTAHDGSSFLNTVEKSPHQYTFDFDHTDANDWGGLTFNITGFYWVLDSSISLDTIKSKFSNYTDA